MWSALDYIDWRGDLSFKVSPVNCVDVFLCSQLATPDYAGIVSNSNKPVLLGNVVKEYFETHEDSMESLGVLQSQYVHPMLHKLPEALRFKRIKLAYYFNKVNPENEEQCSAVTVVFPSGNICISFRGTDDTIIAWKEDFNLAIMDKVPAYDDALNYIKRVSKAFPGAEITVCGHSKGGNIAVYASVMAPKSIRDRIVRVYSFDGPGFRDVFLKTKQYTEMKDRIITVISDNSFVGVLMKRAGTERIVHANVEGPMAHDGFNWEVMGTDFVSEQSLNRISATFEDAMDSALNEMTTEEKKLFTDELFDTLLSTGAVTCSDLTKLGVKTFSVLSEFGKDEKVKAFGKLLTEEYMKSTYDNSKLSEFDRDVNEKIINTTNTVKAIGKSIKKAIKKK